MGGGFSKTSQERAVNLNDFKLLKSIGKGAYGKVKVVEHRKSNKLLAMKYMNKVACIKMKTADYILRERDLLEQIEHPYVCNLRFSFQSSSTMFMVLDLMLGGDLRFHIERKRFDEVVIRHWISEIACGLAYLHGIGIIHRDIKPENILMDEYGHVALTDFNVATKFNPNEPNYSIAGTIGYIAPEIILNTGYTCDVDWWSLGVVMYECIYNVRPFTGETADEVFHSTLHKTISFPTWKGSRISNDCIKVMSAFLERDSKKRLCSGPNKLKQLKSTEFFSVIDWKMLEVKKATSPFVPDKNTSNFDIMHEMEEVVNEENRVDDKLGRLVLEKYGAELLQIERDFLTFDYYEYEKFRGFIENSSINPAADMSNAAPKRLGAWTKIETYMSNDLNLRPPNLEQQRKSLTFSDISRNTRKSMQNIYMSKSKKSPSSNRTGHPDKTRFRVSTNLESLFSHKPINADTKEYTNPKSRDDTPNKDAREAFKPEREYIPHKIQGSDIASNNPDYGFEEGKDTTLNKLKPIKKKRASPKDEGSKEQLSRETQRVLFSCNQPASKKPVNKGPNQDVYSYKHQAQNNALKHQDKLNSIEWSSLTSEKKQLALRYSKKIENSFTTLDKLSDYSAKSKGVSVENFFPELFPVNMEEANSRKFLEDYKEFMKSIQEPHESLGCQVSEYERYNPSYSNFRFSKPLSTKDTVKPPINRLFDMKDGTHDSLAPETFVKNRSRSLSAKNKAELKNEPDWNTLKNDDRLSALRTSNQISSSKKGESSKLKNFTTGKNTDSVNSSSLDLFTDFLTPTQQAGRTKSEDLGSFKAYSFKASLVAKHHVLKQLQNKPKTAKEKRPRQQKVNSIRQSKLVGIYKNPFFARNDSLGGEGAEGGDNELAESLLPKRHSISSFQDLEYKSSIMSNNSIISNLDSSLSSRFSLLSAGNTSQSINSTATAAAMTTAHAKRKDLRAFLGLDSSHPYFGSSPNLPSLGSIS